MGVPRWSCLAGCSQDGQDRGGVVSNRSARWWFVGALVAAATTAGGAGTAYAETDPQPAYVGVSPGGYEHRYHRDNHGPNCNNDPNSAFAMSPACPPSHNRPGYYGPGYYGPCYYGPRYYGPHHCPQSRTAENAPGPGVVLRTVRPDPVRRLALEQAAS
jgi:hypothetical protein